MSENAAGGSENGPSVNEANGDHGNLELLLCAALAEPESRWSAELHRLVSSVLNGIDRDGWSCANPLGVETAGLMTGITGIGYVLLRLAEPIEVPSILMLEPSPAARTRLGGGMLSPRRGVPRRPTIEVP